MADNTVEPDAREHLAAVCEATQRYGDGRYSEGLQKGIDALRMLFACKQRPTKQQITTLIAELENQRRTGLK